MSRQSSILQDAAGAKAALDNVNQQLLTATGDDRETLKEYQSILLEMLDLYEDMGTLWREQGQSLDDIDKETTRKNDKDAKRVRAEEQNIRVKAAIEARRAANQAHDAARERGDGVTRAEQSAERIATHSREYKKASSELKEVTRHQNWLFGCCGLWDYCCGTQEEDKGYDERSSLTKNPR